MIYTEQQLREMIRPMLDGVVAPDSCTDALVKLIMQDREVFRREAPSDTSDGYHTFDELYRFRMLYNAAWFNTLAEWQENEGDQGYKLFKSHKHSDGEIPFGGGWFVVGAQLPKIGQITNHYEDQYWDLFVVPERARAPVWDGHTAQMVADRLEEFLRPQLQSKDESNVSPSR